MPRLKRICPPDIPQHIIQRGNNRQPCFASVLDYAYYINCLKESALKYCVDIHAWILMTNHVHLLMTPRINNGISLLMQDIGRNYVRYFNFSYQRTGTLWEGRFKSSLVDSELYLLACYRYIELNPVRARMVSDPSEYSWSSYQCNGIGKKSDLITFHPQYLALGNNKLERLKHYRQLFFIHTDPLLLTEIRTTINTGMALGSDKFKLDVELLVKRRVSSKKAGRPKKE
ncbi:MAG: transposase [Gammaproteobacteria bacterium]|nr:transposase [Gammaproteobacteria bacterium]